MVRNIPEEIPLEWASVPDMQGAWIILQPIEADMQLVQSGHLVSGTYCNSKIEGTIEGALFKEGEDIIFIGKWADQLGRGDFSVFHSQSRKCRSWQNLFPGKMEAFQKPDLGRRICGRNEIMQITDHIHALKIPFQITDPSGQKIPRFVYAFLIYGEKICLIDSGVAGSEKIILDYLKRTGRSPAGDLQAHPHPRSPRSHWCRRCHQTHFRLHRGGSCCGKGMDRGCGACRQKSAPFPAFSPWWADRSRSTTHCKTEMSCIWMVVSLCRCCTPPATLPAPSPCGWLKTALSSRRMPFPLPEICPSIRIFWHPSAPCRGLPPFRKSSSFWRPGMSRAGVAKPIASWMKGCNICNASTAAFSRWREKIRRRWSWIPCSYAGEFWLDLGLPPIMANPLVAASFQASLKEEIRRISNLSMKVSMNHYEDEDKIIWLKDRDALARMGYVRERWLLCPIRTGPVKASPGEMLIGYAVLKKTAAKSDEKGFCRRIFTLLPDGSILRSRWDLPELCAAGSRRSAFGRGRKAQPTNNLSCQFAFILTTLTAKIKACRAMIKARL